ncbi:MAG: hypothetical protein IAE91_13325, partial [Ignavibacteriaceae bacterium]|nr:hypothetical protein [Ignavibacteriaceae bacterium]
MYPLNIFPVAKIIVGKGIFTLSFRITGAIDEIVFPEKFELISRETGLWNSTCFELFISEPETETYHEFNFSPEGYWNCFINRYYRSGINEVEFSEPDFSFKKLPDSINFHFSFALENLPYTGKSILLNPVLVLEMKPGILTYWANIHPQKEADFHDKSKWLIYNLSLIHI